MTIFQVCGASAILRILHFCIIVVLAVILAIVAFRHRGQHHRTQSHVHIHWPSIRHMWLGWYSCWIPFLLVSYLKSLCISKNKLLHFQLPCLEWVHVYGWELFCVHGTKYTFTAACFVILMNLHAYLAKRILMQCLVHVTCIFLWLSWA